MFRGLLANIPDVTKNLLILNVLFFIGSYVIQAQGMNPFAMLGMFYPASDHFEPYQIVTHFFMHGGLGHIFFNMFGLVIFGSHLERIWGKRRFAFYYFATAIGAAILYFGVQAIEVTQITGEFFPNFSYEIRDQFVYHNMSLDEKGFYKLFEIYEKPVLGASGAVYGLLLGFAMLFPNTQLQLLFPPVSIKAKYLAAILAGLAFVQGYMDNPGDSVAHFAHLGGMLFGFIIIKIWQRNRQNFW